jgi:2-keto-4-pentenoate hydratase/2-oxohepta-3-ene-1,7-dioic acid hydratase in catechol pathway
MKIAVFDDYRVGLVEGDQLFDVTAAFPPLLEQMPKQRINWLITHWAKMEPALAAARAAAKATPLEGKRLLPPNPGAGHVFAAPANYRKHIGELGARALTKGRSAREQGFFLKAPASLVGASEAILLPHGSGRRFDHESELAVIVGRGGRDIPRERAMEHVFGYSCLIDATMRIEKDQFEEERSMRKSFESFTPLGPFLVTADEVADPGALRNQLWVNGELRQEANTSEMIVGIAELIELISSVLPIAPGDVIATGTPEGVGPFKPGDLVKIAIEKIGSMSLPVRERAERSPRAF